MKISAVNEVFSLIANIGVIASIVFLGLEMQQNTEMMQSQTRNSIMENQLSFYERAIENNEFAEVIAQKRLDPNSYLTGSPENFQYALFIASQQRMWENEFYQYQVGLFDQDEFEARTNLWRREIGFEANLQAWRQAEDSYSPDFRDFLNGMISELSIQD